MHDTVLLDGGLGHLLKHWGLHVSGLSYDQQFLAGVLANEAEPKTVQRAHAAYIRAGCTCITTNNFVATKYNLSKVGREKDVASLTQLAGQLARQTVEDSQRQVLVAGSLPPLQESYQSTNLPSHTQMVEEYSQIAAALQPYVDVYLAETLSTVAEAQAALQATAQLGKPVWVSFTLEDSSSCCLRSKESLADAVQAICSTHSHLAAVLVNCCAPAAVTAALPVLKQHAAPGLLIGCYANGFKTTTTQWLTGNEHALVAQKEEDYDESGIIKPEAYLAYAKGWQAAGSVILGGCCGVGPEHMQLIAGYMTGV